VPWSLNSQTICFFLCSGPISLRRRLPILQKTLVKEDDDGEESDIEKGTKNRSQRQTLVTHSSGTDESDDSDALDVDKDAETWSQIVGPSKVGNSDDNDGPDIEKGAEEVSQRQDQVIRPSELGDSGNMTCSICLCEYESGDRICLSRNHECKHHFHAECGIAWLAKHSECPMCRADYLYANARERSK